LAQVCSSPLSKPGQIPSPKATASLLLVAFTLIAVAACLSPSSPRQVVDTTGRNQDGLNTYAFAARDVDIQTNVDDDSARHSWHRTTRVRVKLTANQLQQTMSVITASPKKGLVHNVIDTFRFLKVCKLLLSALIDRMQLSHGLAESGCMSAVLSCMQEVHSTSLQCALHAVRTCGQ
jgi:hypothetical protein